MEEGRGLTIRPIARIHSELGSKFGAPRQSGVVPELRAEVVFEEEFRREEAVRGLEGFSHIWLIWEFSENRRRGWSPTVRPPRLGGNTRLGVFATRSPVRPNPLGLSCVRLEAVEPGPILRVSGADLVDGTPIYDIKPYVPYTDAHPEARGGFASADWERRLEVDIPPHLAAALPAEKLPALRGVLEQDPRPAYQAAEGRVYGMSFAGYEVKFTVSGGVLRVLSAERGGK